MQAAQKLSTPSDSTVDPYHPDCVASLVETYGAAEALRMAARVLLIMADRGPDGEGCRPAMVFAANMCIHMLGNGTAQVIH